MSKPIPSIQKYMSTVPHSIGEDQTIEQAHTFMKKYEIRHLPVLRGGSLVGMLTERDLSVIEMLQGVDPHTTPVSEAMSSHVYAVGPEAMLDEVVDEMARRKYGSAVVVQNGKVVGIFTAIDACKALHDLLHGRLAKA
jgi:acetoin utilization protein AcuB